MNTFPVKIARVEMLSDQLKRLIEINEGAGKTGVPLSTDLARKIVKVLEAKR